MDGLNITGDFSDRRLGREKWKTLRRSINSLIWMLTVFVYLMTGMLSGAWYPGWLAFPLAFIATRIVNMIFALREDF